MAEPTTTSTVIITPRIERAGDEQGIDRLSMLDFLRGKDGPWSGSGTERWVRYRGHHVERFHADPQGTTFRLTYTGSDGQATSDWFKVRLTSIVLLRDLDDVIDVVLDRWPLEEVEPDAFDGLAGIIAELGRNHAAIHTAWVNGHADWLRELLLEQTRRIDDLIREGVVERSAVFPERPAKP